MTQEKYTTKPAGGLLFLAFAILQLGTMIVVAQIPLTDPLVIFLGIMYLLIVLQLLFGTYLIIDDTAIHTVAFPLIHRKIPYDTIKSVSLQGMPLFGNSIRMLFVDTHLKEQSLIFTDKSGVYRIGNDAQYNSRVIADVIKSIRNHRQDVKVDPLAQAFLKIVDSKQYKGTITYKILKEEVANGQN